MPIGRQPAQCLACGQLVVVDWHLEHDQAANEVTRWPAPCPACGVILTPPE